VTVKGEIRDEKALNAVKEAKEAKRSQEEAKRSQVEANNAQTKMAGTQTSVTPADTKTIKAKPKADAVSRRTNDRNKAVWIRVTPKEFTISATTFWAAMKATIEEQAVKALKKADAEGNRA